jgi:phosphoribosylaminoimidazole-succinocarboxamide synthase
MDALVKTEFNFPGQTNVYKGKVRDVHTIDNGLVVMIASDRISAFDHILPKGIPHKGQVLNQVATYFLDATKDIVPNWLIATPDPSVAVGYACEPLRVEMVIRGYLAGHSAREYKAGRRILCGVALPEGMKENDRFPEPIITPATKADEGHDEDISREDIIAKNVIPEAIYVQLEKYTRALFQRGTEMAAKQGLILVDTKYEFGLLDGKVILIDEIHTPDSSRYFYADGYEERQAKGENQKQLSKEFVREWLIENNFQGLDGQTMPEMPDSFVKTVTERYVELYEKILGKPFEPADTTDIVARVNGNVVGFLEGYEK